MSSLDNKPYSLDEFKKLSKEQSYQVYLELFEKHQSYQKLMNKVSNLEAAMQNGFKEMNERLNRVDQRTSINNQQQVESTYNSNTTQKETSRFKNLNIQGSTRNLVIGSSIIRRIPTYKLPADTQIHAYRGSTTQEKLDLVNNYNLAEKDNMCTVTIQDGTNSILKLKDKSINDLFFDYETLVEAVKHKFAPDKLYLCEVPPLYPSKKNEIANQRIDSFNQQLHDTYGASKYVKIIVLNRMIKGVSNYGNKMFWDDIHLNDNFGIPFLLNCLMSTLMKHSNNLPRLSYVKQKRPDLSSYDLNSHQSYNYMHGI